MSNRRDSSGSKLFRRQNAFWFVMAIGLVAAVLMYWAIERKEPPASSATAAAAVPSAPEPAATSLAVARPVGEPLTVTYIGDSITRGSGASAESETFRERVNRKLSEGGPVAPIVSAIGGARLQTVADATTVSPDTDLAIIELGTNDSGTDPTELKLFGEQYTALLQKVKASAPNASILCLGVWRREGAAYDQVIISKCKEAGGFPAILRDIAGNQVNRGPDGRPVYGASSGVGDNFHPNDTGYSAIAERIMKVTTVS